MNETDDQRQFRRDARVLGELGQAVRPRELPRCEVRIPKLLAEEAVAAWARDHEGHPAPETFDQRVLRHRAGVLALIGLGISDRGRWESDQVVVDLALDLIGIARDAADDLGAQPPTI